MKLREKHSLKSALIILVLLILHIHDVSGQSIFVRNTGAEGKVLKKYIEPSELKRLVDYPVDSIWIIDVRSEKAYLNGHIPTAKLFPSGTIMNRLNEIPREKYLILYCTVGGMAKIVSKQLKKAKYKRYIVWGGISRWRWEKETGLNPYHK